MSKVSLPVAELRSTIRRSGLRSTAPRIAVLRQLLSSKEPISHAELFERLAPEGMDRTTVYRNLVDLTDVGLVERTDFGDHVWRFALRSGPDAQHVLGHPHFTCTDCGAIACVPEVELQLRPGKRGPRAVTKKKVEVQLRGLCDECG